MGGSVAWALEGMAISRALSTWARAPAGGARLGMTEVEEVEGGRGMHPAEVHGLSEVGTKRKLDPASGEDS